MVNGWMSREVRELTDSVFEYSMLGVRSGASCMRGKHVSESHPTLQISAHNLDNIDAK